MVRADSSKSMNTMGMSYQRRWTHKNLNISMLVEKKSVNLDNLDSIDRAFDLQLLR